ncbi:MAG: sigma-70 family RNA polymerase sigma factor [Chitinivibrionales bacterium]|nr:sigma-70 family RNA polymerase sigma factor [Chitinivibrionales bacterium]MBD3397386.1 sigma-70 family RNA polymerase sigma factor [Chitinivibrionales bacterium]
MPGTSPPECMCGDMPADGRSSKCEESNSASRVIIDSSSDTILPHMTRAVEKRRDPRVPLSYVSVGVCSVMGEASPSEFCSVVDLSAGGMRFAARGSYEPGSHLRLTFNLPGTGIPIRADATVIHNQQDGDLVGTGVQFRDLALAERKLLREFVDEQVQSGARSAPDGPISNDRSADYLKPAGPNSDSSSVDSEGGSSGDQPTQHLINQCVNGDRRAQQKLFRQYRDVVYSLVYRLLGSDFDMDDVLQQVFVNVFKSLESFKGLSSLDTWVYRITVKVCTDQLRKKYRKRKLIVVGSIDDESSGLRGATEHTPHSRLEQRELADTVHGALARLTEDKRVVLVMYEMEGMSLEEIADIIQKPLGTVKSRLFHARRELERLLRKHIGLQ